jgi:hypothetical protein
MTTQDTNRTAAKEATMTAIASEMQKIDETRQVRDYLQTLAAREEELEGLLETAQGEDLVDAESAYETVSALVDYYTDKLQALS